MLRWILVGLAVLGLVVSWLTESAAVLALALIGTFVCVFWALFAFAAERIADRSRPDTAMLSTEDLTRLGTRGTATPRDAARRDSDAVS